MADFSNARTIDGKPILGAGALGEAATSAPNAPTITKATSESNSEITVHWTHDDADVEGFKLEESDDGANWFEIKDETAGTSPYSYTRTGLPSGGRRYYRAYAYHTTNGNSDYGATKTGYTFPVRINFGKDADGSPFDFTDTGGNSWWKHDTAIVYAEGGGATNLGRFLTAVSGTTNPELYQANTYTWPPETIYLRLDVVEETFDVVAKFAEQALDGMGIRVFDIVDANGPTVLVDDLDVWAEAGEADKAHDESFEVTVGASDRFALNLVVDQDTPMISALEIDVQTPTAVITLGDLIETNESYAFYWLPVSGATTYEVYRKIGAGTARLAQTIFADEEATYVSYIDRALDDNTFTWHLKALPGEELSEEIVRVHTPLSGLLFVDLSTRTGGWSASAYSGSMPDDEYSTVTAGDGSETAYGDISLTQQVYEVETIVPHDISDLGTSVPLAAVKISSMPLLPLAFLFDIAWNSSYIGLI